MDLTGSSLHCRAAGIGPAVVCLHSSGGSSAQWQPLIERESRQFRIIAADFHGHGGSPAPAIAQPYTLATESEALARSMAGQRGKVHLVGHSYGAAVALDFAIRYPQRVRALTLYEPVLFELLDAHTDAWKAVIAVGHDLGHLVRSGAPEAAAARFIDYWAGAGSWGAMTPGQQAAVMRRIGVVARHFEALFDGPIAEQQLRNIEVPVLLLSGQNTRDSTAAIAARVAQLIPAVSWVQIAGAGHLGPITHADTVNSLIAGELHEHALIAARNWAEAA
jgi:pimeloyl-ACP methyl ester carboxylesterase